MMTEASLLSIDCLDGEDTTGEETQVIQRFESRRLFLAKVREQLN